MRFIKIIFGLIVEFVILYLMFAFSQWTMNAQDWGSDLRGMFSGVFLMLGFFITMIVLMVDDINDGGFDGY